MYVEMRNIYKQYGNFRASDNVSFGIEKGKLAALLGPSGSGKTTLLRMIAGLENPNAGDIFIDGKRVNDIPAAKRGIGFVFQSYALFRYMTVYDNIAFGLKVQKADKTYIKKRVTELIELIGLKGLEKRYPSQLSGGQRQRIGIARALALEPQIIICDEAVSALDVSVQAQVLNLLQELKEKLGLTYFFISHNLNVVYQVSDRVGVMYLGNFVEVGEKEKIYSNPMHPYTQALLSAVPVPDPTAKRERILLEGSIPSAHKPPTGCKFHTRCPKCMECCKTQAPERYEVDDGHYVYCHLYDKERRKQQK